MTLIYMTYSYGAYDVCFRKVFDFEFTPFMELTIRDDEGSMSELDIKLRNNQYQTTSIFYSVSADAFEINIRYRWPDTVSDEEVNNIIHLLTKKKWDVLRDDSKIIKELSLKEYSENNKRSKQ